MLTVQCSKMDGVMQFNRLVKQIQTFSGVSRIYFLGGLLLAILVFSGWLIFRQFQRADSLSSELKASQANSDELVGQLASTSAEVNRLLNEDQRLINQRLEATISAIEKTYDQSVKVYEDLLDLKGDGGKTTALDKLFASILAYLGKRDYPAATGEIAALTKGIADERAKLVTTFTIPESVPASNTPPGAGYSRQKVTLDIGEYLVSIVTADLNSTRVIVDTASDATCTNNCPVASLATYVARSGAFAGINGSYFCPASYPSCAGKTNSFDTLAMNKNKVIFNHDNNVYSTVPAVTFSGSSANFYGRSMDVPRDTGLDSILANQPLLVSGGTVVFGGDGDPKKGSKGGRSFVGASGSKVYIGVVHSATVAEAARVLQAMGIQNALNLDSGGSTALWSGGYKVGPGRDIPNVLLFVGK